MAKIKYLMDHHVISGAEAAYSRIFKLWLPDESLPVVTNNSVPEVRDMEPLWLYDAQLSVVHATGYAMYGMRMSIVEISPGRDCGYLASDWQGPGKATIMRAGQPVLYGYGWAMWAGPLVAGDVVIFRAKYEVMK